MSLALGYLGLQILRLGSVCHEVIYLGLHLRERCVNTLFELAFARPLD